MRARNLKPSFFLNEELAACDPLARILFSGLWCVADREGRLEYRPARLKAAILPYDKCDIAALTAQLAAHGFIQVYGNGEARYLQVVNFVRHQWPHNREPQSTIPAPDGESTEISLAKTAKTTKSKANGKHPIGDWKPTEDEMARIAERYKRTPAQMAAYFTELRDYCARTGSQYADYLAAYRTAVRGDWGGHAK